MKRHTLVWAVRGALLAAVIANWGCEDHCDSNNEYKVAKDAYENLVPDKQQVECDIRGEKISEDSSVKDARETIIERCNYAKEHDKEAYDSCQTDQAATNYTESVKAGSPDYDCISFFVYCDGEQEVTRDEDVDVYRCKDFYGDNPAGEALGKNLSYNNCWLPCCTLKEQEQ